MSIKLKIGDKIKIIPPTKLERYPDIFYNKDRKDGNNSRETEPWTLVGIERGSRGEIYTYVFIVGAEGFSNHCSAIRVSKADMELMESKIELLN